MKNGIIFDNSQEKRVVKVGQIRNKLRLVNKIFSKFGKYCLVLAGVIVLWIIGPVLMQELRYGFIQTDTGKTIEKVKNTDMSISISVGEKKERPDWLVPDDNFSIYIPKIAAKSVVIPDVDQWDKKAYSEALKKGVAAAKDLSNPGDVGTTYLFAHSVGSRADFARYNAIFYLLHKLDVKDGIEIVYKGDLYKYQVWEKRIIDDADLSYFAPQISEERLVLQTCYPPGTSWKRLIVIAKRV